VSPETSGRLRATYRVQLQPEFTFDDLAGIVDYLDSLGISHVYCSPYLQAKPGSPHGYDVVDHTSLNQELGGNAAHERMCATLTRHGMGHIYDVVPNHMATAGRLSVWWWDVLKNGPSSSYARYFDIDWDPPERRLRNKILVPILGDHYGRVLEAGDIRLALVDDEIVVRYEDLEVPVAPGSIDQIPGAPSDLVEAIDFVNSEPALLHALLEAQNYRLAFWRTDLELNYRRFFDIDDLAALRVEEPDVFEHVHSVALGLVDEGKIEGLRIDHVDGLRNPLAYLRRLRRRAPAVHIFVEKILEPGERLPADWPVEGTTGYDWLNLCNGLFIDPASEAPLSELYATFTGEISDLHELEHAKKILVMEEILASDLARITALLLEVCERHTRYRDYTRLELQEAIREVTAALDVYRTYVDADDRSISGTDMKRIDAAMSEARDRRGDLDPNLFEFIAGVLKLEFDGLPETNFLMRWQQTTGPVMAKAVEDTLFYNYNRLVSLNEVGGDARRWGTSLDEFHRRNAAAAGEHPLGMLTTSTHDTKRSEDVRARIDVLTEVPSDWAEAVHRWSAMNEIHRTGEWPDRNTEYLIYQTLVGAHPLDVDRALEYVKKATKEAKVITSWTSPNAEFDQSVETFLRGILGDSDFTTDLESFVTPIVAAGRNNSLAQTLLKLTAPGTPDIYQGCELWNLSLVDPDNRGPVDFEARRKMLDFIRSATTNEVLDRMDEGAPKMFVIHRTLDVRRRLLGAFGVGSAYDPLWVNGPGAVNIVAYLRGGVVVTVVPRLTLTRPPDWGSAAVSLPTGEWRDEFTGATFNGDTPAGSLLQGFPVALLTRSV
jgi:(1->4)-alpha-D-glucan 1-alpha-D-glucosylmutase